MDREWTVDSGQFDNLVGILPLHCRLSSFNFIDGAKIDHAEKPVARRNRSRATGLTGEVLDTESNFRLFRAGFRLIADVKILRSRAIGKWELRLGASNSNFYQGDVSVRNSHG
jgi:hypothetical protein